MAYQLILTRNCNFACGYCYQHIKSDIVMSNETIARACSFVLHRLLENRHRPDIINISGGDCLLYPEKVMETVSSIISGCKKEDIPVPSFEVSTNASLLTGDIIDFFEKNKVSLFIGFDGTPASQNQNRVLKNSGEATFNKCFNNIKNLHLKNPDISITINGVISNNNVQWLNNNFDFLYEAFPRVPLTFNIAFNSLWDDKSLEIFKTELNLLANKYIEIITTKNPSFVLSIFDKQINLAMNEKYITFPRCGAGASTLGITPEGYIEACTQLIGSGVEEYCIIGNLEQGIDSDKSKLFRNSLLQYAELGVCAECDLKFRCYNYCPSTNYLSSKDIYAVSPSQCEISKILIYASDFVLNELDDKMPSVIESRFLETPV
jgi:uncharacterized protein